MGLTTHNYSYRLDTLQKIKKNGIDVFIGGGDKNRVSMAELAGIYRESKFVINFSGKPDSIIQCKGRVVEATLSGACLIERNNPETNHWLTPNVDYLPYDCLNEIPDKINQMLQNPERYEAIRSSGQQKAEQNFGAQKTWSRILDFAAQLSS
ncbi:MAG: glycosyltransferase [Lentisphaeria bacterium]|jgi:glycosyltransferase involved in cell wall biosynthesis|nr:glycosyltransferase [Lentisphaeria bacterium]